MLLLSLAQVLVAVLTPKFALLLLAVLLQGCLRRCSAAVAGQLLPFRCSPWSCCVCCYSTVV